MTPAEQAERARLVAAVKEAASNWVADLQEGYPAHGESVDFHKAMAALVAFDAAHKGEG